MARSHVQPATSATTPLRLLLIGYGRMGKLVEALAPDEGCLVGGVLDEAENRDGAGLSEGAWSGIDVAIDFSVAAAVPHNLTRLAALGKDVVVGTTGWDATRPDLREAVARAGIGVVVAPNFSTGLLLFQEIVDRAARLFSGHAEYGAWLHELHHSAKRDAPSGTALSLERTMKAGGYDRAIDVAASRVGHIPGTHTVGFDGPSETITLTHSVRDRGTFARGALAAARWVHGRKGWFTMQDVLGLTRGNTP